MEPSPSFNRMVYTLVRHIPPGKVLNYGRVAEMLGVPQGAREVGWALSALKGTDHDVPWHRVVNAKGRVSIKGSPDAAIEQRVRLEAEGIAFDEKGYLDMAEHLWKPSFAEVEDLLSSYRDSDPD